MTRGRAAEEDALVSHPPPLDRQAADEAAGATAQSDGFLSRLPVGARGALAQIGAGFARPCANANIQTREDIVRRSACIFSSTFLLSSAVLGCGSGDEDSAPLEPGSSPDALARDATSIEAAGANYTATGELVRSDDWLRWVFLGASLNLSYEDEPPPADFFANVFMEPSAYAHFEQTGEFPDGTQTAAVGYLASGGAAPAEHGLYAGENVVFEMSVKDSALDPLVPWRYYSFGDAATAPANPREACFDCHADHAATDHVFTQFYPVLRELVSGERSERP
jgi:hypothetical protein